MDIIGMHQQAEQTFKTDEAKDDESANRVGTHLVRSILDLPIFTSIEGYSIASYNIDGEAYLCLPQFLNRLQEDFPRDTVIKMIEETFQDLPYASPKQLEGFKKAGVITNNAKSCSLIRRSEADRIGLRLFDLSTHEKFESNRHRLTVTSETGSDTEDESQSSTGTSLCEQSSFKTSDLPQAGASQTERNTSQPQADDSGTHDNSDKSNPEQDTSAKSQTIDLTERLQGVKNKLPDDPECSENYDKLGKIYKLRRARTGTSSAMEPELFESQAQPNILNLARAASSTLMIQVYHKCFGMCNGFYYPSMLDNANSKCIECKSCHALLSPRRFIGHTHGNKETNVCHWGFDSNNWRDYIHLSRKQSMNNLDDDELLVKFNRLKSISESVIGSHKMTGKATENKITLSKLPVRATVMESKVHRTSDQEIVNHDTHGMLSKERKRSRLNPVTIDERSHRVPPTIPYQGSQGASTSGQISFPSSLFQISPINFANPSLENSLNQQRAIHPASIPSQNSSLDSLLLSRSFDHELARLEMLAASSLAPPLASLQAPFRTPQSTSFAAGKSDASIEYFENLPTTSSTSMLNHHQNIDCHHPMQAHSSFRQILHADRQLEMEKILTRDLYLSNNLADYLKLRKVDASLAKDIIAFTLSLVKQANALV